ncbi:MAG: secretin and TonB N-terminal domain-containing protein [Bdellovibrionales bacterium]|nr:secretin and TonB N-terminal domain-containing protein [Bdellovibrionales bacterium]
MIRLNLKCLLVFLLVLSCLVSCTTTSPKSPSSSDDLVLDSEGDDFTDGEDGDDPSKGLTSDKTKEGTEDNDVANELDSDMPSDEESGSSEFKDEEFAKDDLKDGDGELDSTSEKGEDPFANAPDEPQGVASEKLPIESASNEGEPLEGESNQNRNSISDIKFLANQAGGTVVVDTTGPAKYKTRVNESTNQFVLEIANVNLPSRLKRPYIMKEFEGEFAAINAYQSAGSSTARIVVQMRNPGKALVQREGNSILVLPPTADNLAASVDDAEAGDAVNPEDAETAEEKEAKEASYDVQSAERDEKTLGAKSLEEYFSGDNRFYGRRLSIQTKDADVRDALNFIAEYSGVNMIISDDVTGTISLKLRQVPWDQALVTIMRSKRLGYIRQGNVIRISTLTTLQAEADSSRAILESQKSLTPVRVKVIPVSYADVDSLTKQLGPFLSDKKEKSPSIIVQVR